MVGASQVWEPSSYATPVFLLLALASLACGRINFSPLDLDADLSQDAPLAESDAGPPLDIRCGTLTPVAPTAPANSRIEPAMRIDGLNLYSRSSANMDWLASRANATAPFGDWMPTDNIQSIQQDPSFVDLNGEEIATGSRRVGMGIRQLVLCSPPFNTAPCSQLSVFDSEGAPIVDSIDGPSLAVRKGKLCMAFNRGDTVYVAEPRGQALDEWDAQLVDLGATKSDDPALTKDGAILLAPGVGGILYLEWDAASRSYLSPRIIEGLEGGSPEIGVESENGFELFVTHETRGVPETHRSDCSY